MKTRMFVALMLVLLAVVPVFASGDSPEREVGNNRTTKTWYLREENAGDGVLTELIDRLKAGTRVYKSSALRDYDIVYVEGSIKSDHSDRKVPGELASLMEQLAPQAYIVRIKDGEMTIQLNSGDTNWEFVRQDVINGILQVNLRQLGAIDWQKGWDSSAVCR